ncbi:MAG: hypothetical protein [Caudoviricetes sp.]|nr:MAG: hypothetical protein [Caudoviricetes sp.]
MTEVTIKSIMDDITKLREEMKIKTTEGISKIFEIYPEVSAVAWCQYTPGFNDGDACTNTVGEIYVLKGNVTPGLIDEISSNPYFLEEYDEDGEDEEEHQSLMKDITVLQYEDEEYNKISKFINSIEDELETIYGTNSSIVLTRDHGTVIEEYDCGY